MVHWFDPRLLLRTLFALIVARLFAVYADRRERDLGLPCDGPYRYDAGEEFWIDYVADLGDGWDSTATVAGVLAADSLRVGDETLPHGRVLVMGGDQAYPVASRDEYLARLEAPYYSLHPYSPDDRPRDLFVLPGNHDWYDGLAAFSRLFMQQRWFAGWRTRQSRSYFALQLPQRWWLLAVDVQLENDIDTAQRDYLLAATAAMQPGDRVVLASAVPFWLEAEGSKLRRNLAFLERKLVDERGGRVYLSLAGDQHHYARYAADDGDQRITAGGGGAFLHGTAWLPRELHDGDRRWQREQAWPSPAASRLALWRLFAFPFYNPSFALLLGVLATLLLWGADAASHGMYFASAAYAAPDAGVLLGGLLSALPSSPVFAASLVGWFAAFVAFADRPARGPAWLRARLRTVLGLVHGLLQLSLAVCVVALVLPSRTLDPLAFIATLATLAAWLAIGSGLLFGSWIWITFQVFGCHRDIAWSACRIPDWKNFLRLRVAADGTLTVYVIGIRKVCRRWMETAPTSANGPVVAPADGRPLASRAMLVERIVIRPDGDG